jgi:hypothetical protein
VLRPLARRIDHEFDGTVLARMDCLHEVFVAHVQLQHAAVPAQVVHPLQARDLVEHLPRLGAELRLEPRAEGQRGQAQRWAGQLLGRAQRLHARRGRPGAFEADGRAVEHHHADAEVLERGGRRQPRHAAADDCHVQHGPAVQHMRQRPRLGG